MTTATLWVFTGSNGRGNTSTAYSATFSVNATSDSIFTDVLNNFGSLEFSKGGTWNNGNGVGTSNGGVGLSNFSDSDFSCVSGNYYLNKQFHFKVCDASGYPVGTNGNGTFYPYQNAPFSFYGSSGWNFILVYDVTSSTALNNLGYTLINVYNTQANSQSQNAVPFYSAILPSTTNLQTVANTVQTNGYTINNLGTGLYLLQTSGAIVSNNSLINVSVNGNDVANYYIGTTTVTFWDFNNPTQQLCSTNVYDQAWTTTYQQSNNNPSSNFITGNTSQRIQAVMPCEYQAIYTMGGASRSPGDYLATFDNNHSINFIAQQ